MVGWMLVVYAVMATTKVKSARKGMKPAGSTVVVIMMVVVVVSVVVVVVATAAAIVVATQ